MIVQLLLFTCASALGVADVVPPYGDIYDDLVNAYYILQDNIVSMDHNIPLLNDSRRHYAEIIHVVHDEANHEKSCLAHDYYKDYQRNVNISAAEALVNPQKVIDEVKKVLQDIYNSINTVLQLVKVTGKGRAGDLDKAVHEKLKSNVEKYETSKEVYLAAGLVATQLNNDHKQYFAAMSDDLDAHSFVINGAKTLEKIVMSVKNLYRIQYHYHRSTEC